MTESQLLSLGQRAKDASRVLGSVSTDHKNAALLAVADGLDGNQKQILAANAQDIADGRQAGLTDALIDRLTLTQERLAGMAADTRSVAALPDPVGQEFAGRVLPNGLRVAKRRTPLGVLGVIYEARPNVTIDITALSLKTGNAAILRGGKETLRSNLALIEVIHGALEKAGLPKDSIQYIDNTDRALVTELLRMDQYVDMIIPRGGNALHKLCRERATIPVMTGGIGICHLFVDDTADLSVAAEIIHNAKTQRPTVCNALDTVLVHRSLIDDFLLPMAERLASSGVELLADPTAKLVLDRATSSQAWSVVAAGPEDFDQEWLSLVLGIKVVNGIDDAIDHIQQHSTGHSDGILTNSYDHAMRFVNEVDSAAVYVNASTRFTDGAQFGLGAEVAISTQKLHARGPMGLEELTTYKWVIFGDGHVRP
ncbi:MAG: glutamate-5-semialdehyde dehydrogenase [Chloroflexota bacterium]|nr:glutamate-5-semialdehyde dehydrogenase [Chloroflexota bacterium]